jgi:hypothetical protein
MPHLAEQGTFACTSRKAVLVAYGPAAHSRRSAGQFGLSALGPAGACGTGVRHGRATAFTSGRASPLLALRSHVAVRQCVTALSVDYTAAVQRERAAAAPSERLGDQPLHPSRRATDQPARPRPRISIRRQSSSSRSIARAERAGPWWTTRGWRSFPVGSGLPPSRNGS